MLKMVGIFIEKKNELLSNVELAGSSTIRGKY